MIKKIIIDESSEVTRNQLQKSSMALDDLVWTIKTLDVRQLENAANLLRKSLVKDIPASNSVALSYQSSSPNKHFLIGVLPRLFQDKSLFPQNEDIAEFASLVLKLEMKFSDKRSRYEIIGKIVCETDSLGEQELSMLVKALERLVEDNDKLAQVATKKRAGNFSWNETLQDLLRN
ncbi:hypothetical protein [Iodobacter ciconiae]|uniref:Uncharacterized protein n=1 Tax=Iodobacter ciconiae TaxID=2496266 RepID=A0A3S8ZQW4_9NEIS|nr:hypothetical protein [Iodobacter ciconiae]AZN35867.1 hypothetical protein EJO50_04840 [Iodobacter ciconiae]